MELENRIRLKIRELGWYSFMLSFGLRPDENEVGLIRSGVSLTQPVLDKLHEYERKLMIVLNILGSSRMVIPFDDVGDEIVGEHKLWLLMDFLKKRPEFIPLVESRL